MSVNIILSIDNCSVCPMRTAKRYHTADSFENCYEWACSAAEYRKIGIFDWDDKMPEIPDWCPYKVKDAID